MPGHKLMSLGCTVYGGLDRIGRFLPQLGLRLLLAWTFWTSGLTQLDGGNWLGPIQGALPFPFHLVPADINWLMSSGFELLGAVGLAIGLGTRFWAAALIIIDLVAWYAVHAGNGYNVCADGYKLSLIYLLMLLPLLLSGPGKASLDHLIARAYRRH